MVVFDCFEKLLLLYFFDNLLAQSFSHQQKLCATSINKSITNGVRGKWYCYASKRILLTLRNILVSELLLSLDEKARNQLKYNFIFFEQLNC